MTVVDRRLDPITFEVLRHKLDEIISEAYYTMGRVSGSPVVYEVGDHQEAICTPTGEAVAIGAGVLHWVCSLGAGIAHVMERYQENPGISEGDQFLFNDPYIGAIHAPDLQVLAPIFWEGELIAWAGAASHQTDLGGMDPGSLCVNATDVFQEGFQTPGLKLVEGGVVRRDVEDTLRNMIRAPDLALLDVRAKIAANNVVKARLGDMLVRYGADVVKTLFNQLIDYSEQRVRARLRSIPDGRWRSENSAEGIKEDYIRVCVEAVKVDDEITFDFTGSSQQVESSLNMGEVGTRSSALNPFIAMFCHDIPWNEGVFRACNFKIPEGTILNPQRPAPVSMNVPTGANLLVLTACENVLAKMLVSADEPLRVEAAGNAGGGHNTFVLTGLGRDGNFFATLVLDSVAAGGGALPDQDGPDTSLSHWSVKTECGNVESVEMLYPVLYLWRREVVDSGGPGKYRGGLGIANALVPWGVPGIVNINLGSGAHTRPSLGFSGGYPGAHTPTGVVRGAELRRRFLDQGRLPSALDELGGINERIAAKSVTMFGADDVLWGFVGSGGGGFGDPLERDPMLVARDVAAGAVSERLAEDVYGVVMQADGAPDEQATSEKRSALRSGRLRRMENGHGAAA